MLCKEVELLKGVDLIVVELKDCDLESKTNSQRSARMLTQNSCNFVINGSAASDETRFVPTSSTRNVCAKSVLYAYKIKKRLISQFNGPLFFHSHTHTNKQQPKEQLTGRHAIEIRNAVMTQIEFFERRQVTEIAERRQTIAL